MNNKYRAYVLILVLFAPIMGLNAKSTLIYEHFARLNDPAFKDASNSAIGFEYLHERKRKSGLNSYVNLQAKYYPKNEGMLIALLEAYVSRTRGRTTYTIGRKVLDWTPHEKFWGIGELNGLRGFNLMDNEQEGLIGIHFDKKWKSVDLSIFGSGMYIPQLNPTYKIKNGKISGSNEWTNPPPQFVRFSGQNIPVVYTLDKPDIADIIFQKSFGTRLRYHWDSGAIAAYGIYKPEGLARINATGFYDQSGTGMASVKAKPFINHHIMYGLNASQKIGSTTLKASWDTIDPMHGSDESFEFAAFKIKPVYTTDSFFTISSSWDKHHYVGVSANFIELLRGDSNNTNVFAKKPKWVRAIGIGAWWKATQKLTLSGNYRQDLVLSDALLRVECHYKLTKHFATKLGADFLRAPKTNSYWSPYRANDTIFSSLEYSF